MKLDGFLASDLDVVNAAKVSFAKRASSVGTAEEGLINFLMRERHGTPFEHNCFRFIIRCPIAMAREWFRHRWSSFNEESLRYSPARLDAYVPDISHVRTQVGKPGNYTFETVSPELARNTQKSIELAYERAFDTYEQLVAQGIAREIARMVLPSGIYTEFFWTVNSRSLMNFLSLRNDKNAQREIKEFAVVVESIFQEIMPITHKCFVEHGRVSP